MRRPARAERPAPPSRRRNPHASARADAARAVPPSAAARRVFLGGAMRDRASGAPGIASRRPSSPRCAGCWRRGDRPTSRLAPSSLVENACKRLDPAPAAAPDRPRRRARTRRRSRSWRTPSLAQMHLQAGRRRRRAASRAGCSASGELARSRHAAADTNAASAAGAAVLEDEPDDAQRGAAQRERIARAGRLLADGEEADQRVDLVGERHGDADRRGRAAVARAQRRVMLGDRVGDRRALRRRAARSSGP